MKNDYSLQTVIPTGRNVSLWGLNLLALCTLGPVLYWVAIDPLMSEPEVTEVVIYPSDHVAQTWRMVDDMRSIYQWGLNFKVHADTSDRTFDSLEKARAWWDREYGTTDEYPQCYYNGEWVEPCPL